MCNIDGYEHLPLIDQLIDYIDNRRLQGHFLTALVENDLAQAINRADNTSRRLLFDYVSFLYNRAPAECWGSKEKVQNYLGHRD